MYARPDGPITGGTARGASPCRDALRKESTGQPPISPPHDRHTVGDAGDTQIVCDIIASSRSCFSSAKKEDLAWIVHIQRRCRLMAKIISGWQARAMASLCRIHR